MKPPPLATPPLPHIPMLVYESLSTGFSNLWESSQSNVCFASSERLHEVHTHPHSEASSSIPPASPPQPSESLLPRRLGTASSASQELIHKVEKVVSPDLVERRESKPPNHLLSSPPSQASGKSLPIATFQPPRCAIDVDFWRVLGGKKLNEWKLSSPWIDISGEYDFPTLSAGRSDGGGKLRIGKKAFISELDGFEDKDGGDMESGESPVDPGEGGKEGVREKKEEREEEEEAKEKNKLQNRQRNEGFPLFAKSSSLDGGEGASDSLKGDSGKLSSTLPSNHAELQLQRSSDPQEKLSSISLRSSSYENFSHTTSSSTLSSSNENFSQVKASYDEDWPWEKLTKPPPQSKPILSLATSPDSWETPPNAYPPISSSAFHGSVMSVAGSLQTGTHEEGQKSSGNRSLHSVSKTPLAEEGSSQDLQAISSRSSSDLANTIISTKNCKELAFSRLLPTKNEGITASVRITPSQGENKLFCEESSAVNASDIAPFSEEAENAANLPLMARHTAYNPPVEDYIRVTSRGVLRNFNSFDDFKLFNRVSAVKRVWTSDFSLADEFLASDEVYNERPTVELEELAQSCKEAFCVLKSDANVLENPSFNGEKMVLLRRGKTSDALYQVVAGKGRKYQLVEESETWPEAKCTESTYTSKSINRAVRPTAKFAPSMHLHADPTSETASQIALSLPTTDDQHSLSGKDSTLASCCYLHFSPESWLNLLNQFLLLTCINLKTYEVVYSVAFPVLRPSHDFRFVKTPKYILGEVYTAHTGEKQPSISNNFKENLPFFFLFSVMKRLNLLWREESRKKESTRGCFFWLVDKYALQDVVCREEVESLEEVLHFDDFPRLLKLFGNKEGLPQRILDALVLCFVDPSESPLSPGWLLRNALFVCTVCYNLFGRVLKVLSLKDSLHSLNEALASNSASSYQGNSLAYSILIPKLSSFFISSYFTSESSTKNSSSWFQRMMFDRVYRANPPLVEGGYCVQQNHQKEDVEGGEEAGQATSSTRKGDVDKHHIVIGEGGGGGSDESSREKLVFPMKEARQSFAAASHGDKWIGGGVEGAPLTPHLSHPCGVDEDLLPDLLKSPLYHVSGKNQFCVIKEKEKGLADDAGEEEGVRYSDIAPQPDKKPQPPKTPVPHETPQPPTQSTPHVIPLPPTPPPAAHKSLPLSLPDSEENPVIPPLLYRVLGYLKFPVKRISARTGKVSNRREGGAGLPPPQPPQLTTVQSINLNEFLDPLIIQKNALDLNIKLIKWRMLPEFQPSNIQSLKFLLIGAGSLGCNVARNLVAWGVRHISLVDCGRVSSSNPSRQSLYSYADSQENGRLGRMKVEAAKQRLQEIRPDLVCNAIEMEIPMPGHARFGTSSSLLAHDVARLEELMRTHNVVYLLTDSRESRWLPSLLCAAKSKLFMEESMASHTLPPLCVTGAVGFDSFVVMRHAYAGNNMACYFCNDVTAPSDSISNRTLDQQCTVVRPGIAELCSSLLVELVASLSQHPLGFAASHSSKDEHVIGTKDDYSCLGSVPHTIRGYLSEFKLVNVYSEAFDRCICCSDAVLDAYISEGENFIKRVIRDSSLLEDVSGLKQIKECSREDDVLVFSDILSNF